MSKIPAVKCTCGHLLKHHGVNKASEPKCFTFISKEQCNCERFVEGSVNLTAKES